MNFERTVDDVLLFTLGLNTQGITFVASKFAVLSSLCALEAASKKNPSEFRGKNKQ